MGAERLVDPSWLAQRRRARSERLIDAGEYVVYGDLMDVFEREHRGYLITNDPDRVDIAIVHRFLSEDSYWAEGRSLETTRRAIGSSVMFSACLSDGRMVGGLRVVTDCATFAWICDVFVLPAHRGLGLGKALVQAARAHPCLANSERVLLATADAHELYAGFGFGPLANPQMWMEAKGAEAR